MSQPYHQHCQRALTMPNFSCLRRYRTAARRDLSKAILPLTCNVLWWQGHPKTKERMPFLVLCNLRLPPYGLNVTLSLRLEQQRKLHNSKASKDISERQRKSLNRETGKIMATARLVAVVKFRWYAYIPGFFIMACSFQLLTACKPYLSCLILLYKAKVKELRR